MRRFIAIFLVFTLFFNMNTVALADGNIIEALENTDPSQSLGILNSNGSESSELGELIGNETTKSGPLKFFWDLLTGFMTLLGSPLQAIVNFFPSVENFVFGKSENSIGGTSISPFQLSFFVPKDSASSSFLAGAIQSSTASVYNALRYLVTSIYIIILVYLAVRILLSSVGRQKAHYKSLFQYWITGLLMLFSFHWVMAFIIWLSDIFTEIFASIAADVSLPVTTPLDDAAKAFGLSTHASTLNSYLAIELPNVSGTTLFPIIGQGLQVLIFLAILVASLLIGFIYLKRLLFVALLIIVFPLVVLSYVFDKIGDRKSQTFNLWFKEFTTNVFVQPIHALLLAFIILLVRSSFFKAPFLGPILAVAMLYLLPSGEKFLKQLFQLSSSMGVGGGVMHSLAHQALAMKQIKDMAKPLTDRVSKVSAMNKLLNSQGVTGGSIADRAGKAKSAFVSSWGKKGMANKAGGLLQAAREFSSSTQRKRQLEHMAEADRPRYDKINEKIEKLTGKGSYQEAYRDNVAGAIGALPGLAVGSGFAIMGDLQNGVLAAGFVGKHGANFAESKFSNEAKQNEQLHDKIQASGLESLSDDERKRLGKMYGGEKNIPSKVEVLEDLEFKRRTAKYGSSGDALLDQMALPSRRKNVEKVFGENGILQKNNGKSVVYGKDKATYTDKDGNKYTILGGRISGLKHDIEIPLDGVTSSNKEALINKNLDKAMEKAGYTAANGYDETQLKNLRKNMRASVVKDFDKATEYLETVTHQPPLITTASTQSVNTTSKFNTIDNVIAARANPGEYSVSADAMNTINNKAVATINQEVHKAHFDAIKSNPHVSAAQFSQILADNNIREVTDEHGVTTGYAINDSSKRANYSGAMQQFHALDSSIPATAYAGGVQEIKSINDLSGIAPADFGLSEATYSNVTRQIVADAKSFEAQQKLREIDSNPAAYGISRSAMNEVLEANGISRLNGDLSSDRSLAKATSALEGLDELQAKNPYVATVQQACGDIGTGSVRTERATAYLTQPQLQALQSQGPLQMTYSGKNVTITPIDYPNAEITVPSGIELPEGETVIKAGVVDPLDGNQILQTFANVEYFRAQQPSVTLPDEGTPYEMDMIDLSKLPSEQFNMIRSGDYCIVTDTNGNILYSQRGLSVIPDSHMVSLSPRDTGSGTEYIINSTSPINGDMMTKLREKSALLRARSLASNSEEQKREANTTQNLITELAKKLGFEK